MKNCTPDNSPVCSAAVSYTVSSAKVTPEGQGLWNGPAWGNVPALDINQFHRESKSRHPKVQAKLQYDATHVYVHFSVQDQHVQSFYTNYQDNVCRDSCVEFFFKPREDKAYFNFEINCAGTMLVYYMANHNRGWGGGFAKYVPLPWSQGKQVRIYHNMPRTTPTAIHEPITWQIEAAIPFSILTPYVGEISTMPGSHWSANLYKCGGHRGYEHYASWSPQAPELNFHRPDYFGDLLVGE